MELRPLGASGITVSHFGLGTMTFGEQNDEREAFAQLDLAVDHGVTLIDTAEMYPVPPRAETQGRTEEILGRWLARRGRRDDLVIATKVAGRAERWLPWIRGGPRLTRDHVRRALEGSLRRLGIDYVDLYQVHWPERATNYFGERGWRPRPERDADAVPIEETLAALGELVDEGLVRAIGVSNETPWGVHRYLRAAEEGVGPRIVAIQNPYNLLNRLYEVGLAEFGVREGIPLLAYSPLAFGVLTGKYLDGARPPRARLTLFPHYRRYTNPQAEAATRAYVTLAREAGLDPAQMALAFVARQPWVGSVLVGATTLEQLRTNLAAATLELPEDVVAEIEAIHARYPDPAP